jgi:hypothetical protein
MPIYEYVCRNEDCARSAGSDEPFVLEKLCSMKEALELPECESCREVMCRVYTAMPDVMWVGVDMNGKRRKYNMGPSERANRRHAGWDNGTKVLQPVYRGKGSVPKKDG